MDETAIEVKHLDHLGLRTQLHMKVDTVMKNVEDQHKIINSFRNFQPGTNL